MPLTRSRAGRAGRTLAVVCLASFVLVIFWFVAALATFVLPRQQPLQKADAIVSLSPPTSRLPVALEALRGGLAPQLWLSYVPSDIQSDQRRLVDTTCSDQNVECFAPLSNDTIGEARAVAKLVGLTGAKSVIVTTNVSHSARTRFLFERCLPEGTDIQLLLVDEPSSVWYVVGRMLYETAASVKALAEVGVCQR